MSAVYSGTPNTIILNSQDGRHLEKKAAAGLKPGHLIEVTSADTLQKHSHSGGRALKIFAIEDHLQGKTINDAYITGDVVLAHAVSPNDRVYARLAAAAVAVTRGNALMSAGDGTLAKIVSGSGGGALLYSAVAASAPVTNTTTETAFDKSYTVPANFLKVGDVLRIKAQVIATATHSTDTLTIKLKIGSTVVAATAAVDVADNGIGYIDADIVIRTIGASGTLVATGNESLGVEATVTGKPFKLASTAVDTTATQAITVTATWSVADVGNSVRLDVLDITIDPVDGIETVAFADESVDNSAGSSEAFIKVVAA